MTLAEFKAWMEGFCEALPGGGAPTPEQFAKIRQKLSSVHGDTITVPAPALPGIPELTYPWQNPLQPIVFGGSTGDQLPSHGVVACGIDWSADHLEAVRAVGRAEAMN